MKTNLVKKILSIAIVSIVIALVLVVIVLALIPKRLDNPITSGYASITIYNSAGADQTYYYISNTTDEDAVKGNEIFRDIEDLHADSLKDNLLSALFQGTGSFDIRVENTYYANALTQAKADAKETGTNTVLVYTYTTGDQTLKIDGKDYRDENAVSSTLVTFDMIVMPLGNSDSFEECTIYLADRDSKNTSYQVKFLAHQGELLEYINNLELPVVA